MIAYVQFITYSKLSKPLAPVLTAIKKMKAKS